MDFKKTLKTGQATLEYFLLLAVIAVITILAFSPAFYTRVKDAISGSAGFFHQAADRITQ